MKQKKLIFIGIILIILWQVTLVGAVSVDPIVIKFTAKPGEKVPFSVNFRSSENFTEIVKFTIARPLQTPNGSLEFKTAQAEDFPEASWINISKPQVSVPKGGEAVLTGFVKIPSNAKGFHTIAIMGEQPARESGAFMVSVIYAIRLDVTIDSPQPRVTAEVSDFELTKGKNGEPYLQFNVKNTSIIRLPANAYVAIRNKSTKKLVEKVELRPEAFWNNNLDPIILPDATLSFGGSPKDPILPGQYDLQLFFRYGSSGQILRTTSVQVREKDFIYPANKIKIVRVTPDEISITGKPGTTGMKGIKLENRSNKTVRVVLKPAAINTINQYSILKNTTVEMKNGSEYTLEPGRTVMAIIVVEIPKDAKVQGNYGQILINTLNTDGSKIEDNAIFLEALVPGKYAYSADVTNLSVTKESDTTVFAAIIKSNSNVRVTPVVTLYIKDKSGKYSQSIPLTGEQEKSWVLPGGLMTFTGNLNEKVPAGEYRAEIRINQGNDEIGRSVKELMIK